MSKIAAMYKIKNKIYSIRYLMVRTKDTTKKKFHVLVPGKMARKSKKSTTYQKKSNLRNLIDYVKKNNLILPRRPFSELVKSIVKEFSFKSLNGPFKIEDKAKATLQYAAESFLIQMFECGLLLTFHRKSTILGKNDLGLLKRLIKDMNLNLTLSD